MFLRTEVGLLSGQGSQFPCGLYEILGLRVTFHLKTGFWGLKKITKTSTLLESQGPQETMVHSLTCASRRVTLGSVSHPPGLQLPLDGRGADWSHALAPGHASEALGLRCLSSTAPAVAQTKPLGQGPGVSICAAPHAQQSLKTTGLGGPSLQGTVPQGAQAALKV